MDAVERVQAMRNLAELATAFFNGLRRDLRRDEALTLTQTWLGTITAASGAQTPEQGPIWVVTGDGGEFDSIWTSEDLAEERASKIDGISALYDLDKEP